MHLLFADNTACLRNSWTQVLFYSSCSFVSLSLPAGVSRNLVLKFKDDTIDDSIELTQLLQSSSAISSRLDLSLRTLEGDHIRPMAPVSQQLAQRCGGGRVAAGLRNCQRMLGSRLQAGCLDGCP
jgi:hypothetical protein